MKDQSITLQEKVSVSKPVQTTAIPGRIAELDGLRGIAILLVVSFHYINNQLVNSQQFETKLLAKATSFGWVGVDLFFVLSGFLIGSILIRNKTSNNYFSTFFIRRIVRIVPNYFLAIALFLLITNLPYFADNYFLTGNNVIPWWAYFTMTHNIFMAVLQNMGNDAMSITWSIGIEEQFYIIFPFIVYFLKDKWLPFVLIGFICLAGILRGMMPGWIPGYVLLPCRVDGLAWGVLIAWLAQRTNFASLVRQRLLLLIVVLATNVIFCGISYYKFGDLGPIKHTLFALFFAISVAFALSLKSSWYAAFLRNKILTWVGAISYSLYLFHYMTLGVVHHISGNNHIGINNSRDVVISVVALAVSVAFSWMVYKVIETRFVAMGKRFRY